MHMLNRMTSLALFSITVALALTLAQPARGADFDQPVGPADGAMKVPNGQIVRPAGQTLTYPGRPLDLCMSGDGRTVYVKNALSLAAIDAREWRVRQELFFPAKTNGSMHGIVVAPHASGEPETVYVTTSQKVLLEARVGPNGELVWGRQIALPGPASGSSHSLGIALSKDGKRAFVCLSRNNTLAIVDLAAGAIAKQVPVGVCPYGVVLSPDETTAYVTNFGGRRPAPGRPSALSTGTLVAVDSRGIPDSGTVSKIDLKSSEEAKQIDVGLHPSQIVRSPDGSRLYVANANSDSVSVIDAASDGVVENVVVHPDSALHVRADHEA
jgi:YVTN family beta-propeller protein